MDEFWEEAFKNKQFMWGEQATLSAIETCKHFKRLDFQKILIPGLGYGRNADPFLITDLKLLALKSQRQP